MRRIALCISVPVALMLTVMCCVSAWHNLLHPKTRPDRSDLAEVAIEEFQRDLWLYSATNLHGSDRMYGGIGWNRRNLVALLRVARAVGEEDLPADYWQSLKRRANNVWHSKLRVRQASTLRFERQDLTRSTTYWCFIPLWLAWAVVSAYPIFVISKAVLVRRLRRKRGQCLACGYDLRGNVAGVCPECGTKVTGT